MNSKRFPNKVISDLSGTPLIERILQRVKKVKKIEKIIIATTKRKEDDILVEIAKSNKVEAFRGSENDLVDRYYQAVKGKNVSHILRLPADNPIPDPLEYDRLINYHLKTDNDFSSNIMNFMHNGRYREPAQCVRICTTAFFSTTGSGCCTTAFFSTTVPCLAPALRLASLPDRRYRAVIFQTIKITRIHRVKVSMVK